MQITLDSTVCLKPQQFVEAQEGEVLYTMNQQTGSYLYLNEVATAIWGQLKLPIQVSSLCLNLEREFEVSPTECQTEVLRVLGQLEQMGNLNVQ